MRNEDLVDWISEIMSYYELFDMTNFTNSINVIITDLGPCREIVLANDFVRFLYAQGACSVLKGELQSDKVESARTFAMITLFSKVFLTKTPFQLSRMSIEGRKKLIGTFKHSLRTIKSDAALVLHIAKGLPCNCLTDRLKGLTDRLKGLTARLKGPKHTLQFKDANGGSK
jgi:hypothetical protein